MYFLDESNILWIFQNNKLTELFKIDEILLIRSKHDIEIMAGGVKYQVYRDEILGGCYDKSSFKLFPGRVFNDKKHYTSYSCDVINNLYKITLHDYWGPDVIETNINAEKYVIFEIDITCDDQNRLANTHISYTKKIGNFPIVIKRIIHNSDETYKVKDVFAAKNVQDKTPYEYIIGGYVKTDKAVYSLIDGHEYDFIYPSLFESIVRQGDNYYIRNVCVTDQIEEFDFGCQNTKSARNV